MNIGKHAMKKIESFLKSKLYIVSIVTFAVIAFISRDQLQYLNTYITLFFLVLFALLLASFKNTLYTLPIAFALLYTYNVKNPNLNTISEFNIIYLIVIFILVGLVVHFIRFKPKPKGGVLSLAYLLFGIAYLIPMLYRPFTMTLLQLSFVGLIYFLIYQFYTSTAKVDKDYSLWVLYGFSLLLAFEMTYHIGLGFFNNNLGLSLQERVSLGMRASWYNGDFGWANINDVAIHIALLFGAQFYYIIKYKKQILFWIFPLLTGFVVLLSASRGGYIAMAVSFLIYLILVVKNIDKKGLINLGIVVIIVSVTSYFILPVFKEAFDIMLQGGFDDLDHFSSSRITLYKHAIEIFKNFPVFGGGWEAMPDIGNPDRIQVFHSSLFHAMAVMGSFGVMILVYYFFISFKYLLTNRTLFKSLVFVGVLSSQIYGLFDNTMFMLIYTFATIFIFVLLEQNNEKASDL